MQEPPQLVIETANMSPVRPWLCDKLVRVKTHGLIQLVTETRELHSGLKEIKDAHHSHNCPGARIRWRRGLLRLRPMGRRGWRWDRARHGIGNPPGVLSPWGFPIGQCGREGLTQGVDGG